MIPPKDVLQRIVTIYRLTTAVVIGLRSVVTRHGTDAARIGICVAPSAEIVVVGVVAIAAVVPLHKGAVLTIVAVYIRLCVRCEYTCDETRCQKYDDLFHSCKFVNCCFCSVSLVNRTIRQKITCKHKKIPIFSGFLQTSIGMLGYN